MSTSNSIELILVEWIAWLKGQDRSRKNVRPHFELLFQKWKDCGATFEDLYEPPTGEVKGSSPLQRAIKAHLPVSSIVRSTYKGLKQKVAGFDKTEKEFTDEWNSSIEGTGTEVFFEFFPALPVDHDPEPKVYGNMSKTEYQAQRRYANQFPTLDTRELVKQWKQQSSYNMDVEDVLENVLGDKNETNK